MWITNERNRIMKKTILITLITLGLLLILSGCSGITKVKDEITEQVNRFIGQDDDTEYNRTKYIGENIDIAPRTDFSEGRALVTFNDVHREKGGTSAAMKDVLEAMENKDIYGAIENWRTLNRAALIDNKGKIIWESETTWKESPLIEVSEFRDGLAYFIFEGNEQSMYYILDTEGTVSFTKEYTDDFKILSHGDGLFLCAEHISNFDTDEWQIGAIDKNGDIVVPFKKYSYRDFNPSKPDPVEAPSGEVPNPDYDYGGYMEYQDKLYAYERYLEELAKYEEYEDGNYQSNEISFDDSSVRIEYLGNDVYMLDGYQEFRLLLNIRDQRIIHNFNETNSQGTIGRFFAGFEDGMATVLYNDIKEGDMVCSLGTDGTLTPIISNDWTKNDLPNSAMFNEGLAFNEGAYYNLEGEMMIDFPEYKDHAYICGPFQNGYAPMAIIGADGVCYVTVINKNGELMFDPMPGFDTINISSDGKFATAFHEGQGFVVFTINGTRKVTVNYHAINVTPCVEDVFYDYRGARCFDTPYPIYDGMLCINGFYINIEVGIDYYDANELLALCNDLSLLPRVSNFEQGLDSIGKRAAQLNLETEYRNTRRRHWVGGGFGTTIGGTISAAIKGSVAAEIMNAGSGVLHGIGNSIVKAINNSEMKGMEKSLFKKF